MTNDQPDARTVARFPSVQQVAADLEVSSQTVRRWIRQGRIQAYAVGPRRLHIDPDSLDGLVLPR